MKTKILFIVISFTTFCNAQIVNIPDNNFKANLLQSSSSNNTAKNLAGQYFEVDANNDNQIQVSEAEQVSEIRVNGDFIQTMQGIQSFINLKVLNCSDNIFTTSLDVSGLVNLETLYCRHTQLTSINISGATSLKQIYCRENSLTSLDFSGLANVEIIQCEFNQISTIDASGLSNLQQLICYSNQLVTVNLKNGANEVFDFNSNPNLQYICADDFQLSTIQNDLIQNGNTNCHVNTYCSFTLGGTFYTIQGNQRFDIGNDGCDNNDIIFPNLKHSISNGTITDSFVSNSSGSYGITVQAGTHTISPIFENPSYFNVTPNSFIVNFPSMSSPHNQDFCISANGMHNDLEVLLLPISIALPGFEANYSLVFKNKGTTTQSGTISFSYDENVIDFVSSNPNALSQTGGSVNYSFTNLLPFESRSIDILLNLNSPTETPALNSGDVLTYSSVITGQTDEMPIDNTSILNQTIVNSFDPNDKTCIEGTTITPNMIGEYVHYMIRFENTGTANAQNIVVKDIIDTDKFDINSLIPVRGSHNFETRLSNTNRVEFIFQNINLPFDDTNNDGYVSFKIKTKPNLVIGNTFSNSANIYFDYNFPIITNNYTTTIQNTLSILENESSNEIYVYPNPVKDFLNFKIEQNIFKVEVYDIAGRILSSNSVLENKIDLSELKSGNYILKLHTEKRIMNTKIIKE